jgi:hypothetical protein
MELSSPTIHAASRRRICRQIREVWVSELPHYVIRADRGRVDVWTCYQIQFDGMRRFGWQDTLVREMKTALAGLVLADGEALTGTYSSSVAARCDVENRLFTNPGAIFPVATTAIRWERGGTPPPTPERLASVDGHVHHYRYEPTRAWRLWLPATPLARWTRVPRRLAHDGSARPMWLAVREALLRGAVEVLHPPIEEGTRFGVRIEVHAPARGPRSAPAISEALIDGALCALHAGAPAAVAGQIAQALRAKLPGVDPDGLLRLVRQSDAVFAGSPFNMSAASVQLSPCDEFCDAGEVSIRQDPSTAVVTTSGEVFTLRRADDRPA